MSVPSPSPSGGPPRLPVTFRPVRARRVCYMIAAAVVVCTATIAVLLPGDGTRAAGLGDRLAFVGVGAVIAAFLVFVLSRPRVDADENGLTVVNLFRRRRLTWPEIVHVNLRRGDPWVLLDLDDGDTYAAMGIQSADGARARRDLAQLRALLDAHTRTERDD